MRNRVPLREQVWQRQLCSLLMLLSPLLQVGVKGVALGQ